MHDCELLRQYVETGANKAFDELTSRYRRLVFSTCLREIRDYTAAEDLVQSVFLLLSQKPPNLTASASLAGWLFHSSRLLAKNESAKKCGFVRTKPTLASTLSGTKRPGRRWALRS